MRLRDKVATLYNNAGMPGMSSPEGWGIHQPAHRPSKVALKRLCKAARF